MTAVPQRARSADPPPAPSLPPDIPARGGTLAHACAAEPSPPPPPRATRIRVAGLDLARALAVLGMMTVHLTPLVSDDGMRPLAWIVASGNSAALFAVLAGVGVGLTTGRNHPPSGRAWTGAALNLVVRTLFIGTLGLLLGLLVDADQASIILPTYAVLFVMLVPILRASARFDLVLGLLAAVGAPLVSHVIRRTWELPGSAALASNPNLTLVDLAADPAGSLVTVMLTGTFPALTWFAYACVGLGIGRTAIGRRHVAASLLALGAALAAFASLAGWLLLDVVGGRTQLAAVASRSMSLEAYTDILVWGAGGTLPTTTRWWNAVLAPHTGTPLDLLFTLGIACGVLGACLIVGRVVARPLRPLTTLGSMPLSAYVGHLLMLQVPVLADASWLSLLVQFAILLVAAGLWRLWFSRGPLEMVLGVFTSTVKRWLPSEPPAPARG